MPRLTKAQRLAKAIDRQRFWINSRGGSLAQYVERYGSIDSPDCYGNGGEAIYAADIAALKSLLIEAGLEQKES